MKYVIARYLEDVDWTNGLEDAIIYNKGPYLPNSKHHYIMLPNVGREGHTYLHHIITNYDNLDDYTCFLQGNPFDHTPDIERRLRSYRENPIPFYMLTNRPFCIHLNYDEYDPSIEPLMIETYEYIFGVKKTGHAFIFGAGAQFIVTRDTIRSRPKEFYQRILGLMDKEVHPRVGYVLERFWPMIFTHTE